VLANVMETKSSGADAFPDAVAAMYHARFRSLFRYVDRLTGDLDMAKDIVQETFVRLYQRGSMPDDPHAWLTTVATNLFRDDRRQRRRRAELVTEHAAEAEPVSEPPAADARVIVDEARTRARAALDLLPLRDRRLLLLRHEGYSYRELAHLVGIGESSVGTLLIRATRAFRQAIIAQSSPVTRARIARGVPDASD
jgi:RNA polymerase sigma-70 factor, ECF subfamily